MKILIAGMLALLIGVGGGAFLSGNRVKAELLEAAAQATADSIAVAEADDDVEHGAPVEPVGGGHATQADPTIESATQATHTDTATGPTPERAMADALLQAATEQTDERDTAAEAAAERARLADEGARKLSKIFGAMQAQDAADVLQEMKDEEIEMILKHMSDRLAAQILGVFDPSRAAALSQVVLRTRQEGM
jgi:flagellar motility protein MotE (MotC chaperone)